MPRVFGPSLTSPMKPVMIFVDGGYLRSHLKKEYGSEKDEFPIRGLGASFQKLRSRLSACVPGHGELIRTYYYDASIDESTIKGSEGEERKRLEEKREKQEAFFSKISDLPFCDVRLSHLVKTEEGLRQKGVDIRMAIDMLTKAYDGHYEFAILVAGDGDFVHLVNAVKDAGRRVIGAYYEDNVSPRLRESLDLQIILTKDDLEPV